jgi:flagellar protein FliO/FliZ
VFELVLRIGLSLLVVFGLMWALAKMARRPLAGRGGAAMAVLARQQISRSSSVAVVRVVDRALVIGVTDGHVSMLAETDLAALERQLAGPETTTREAVELDGVAGPGTSPAPGHAVVAARIPANRLGGSVLSPGTWRQTVSFLRERTARH